MPEGIRLVNFDPIKGHRLRAPWVSELFDFQVDLSAGVGFVRYDGPVRGELMTEEYILRMRLRTAEPVRIEDLTQKPGFVAREDLGEGSWIEHARERRHYGILEQARYRVRLTERIEHADTSTFFDDEEWGQICLTPTAHMTLRFVVLEVLPSAANAECWEE